jgi:hypothetical protein
MRLYKSFINKKPYKIFGKLFDIEKLTISGFTYYGKINPNDYQLALGIDWTESHRTENISKNWEKYGYKVEYPLVEDLSYDKNLVFDYLNTHDINIPKLYKLGFSHNNCGGRCFKAGQGHFKLLLEKIPSRFDELEEFENNGNGYTILRKTRNKERLNYPLSELKKDYFGDKEIDVYDIGGCGCFIDEDFDE